MTVRERFFPGQRADDVRAAESAHGHAHGRLTGRDGDPLGTFRPGSTLFDKIEKPKEAPPKERAAEGEAPPGGGAGKVSAVLEHIQARLAGVGLQDLTPRSTFATTV